MRSLIFTGGKHPDIQDFLSYISPYSLVVAADSGYDAAIVAGISPDIVVGDMDSLKDKNALNLFGKEKILKFPKDKDLSDTEIAFEYCLSHGSDDVVLIGGGGGRMDHFFALRNLFDREQCPSTWLGEDTILLRVENERLEIGGLHTDDCISVFSAGLCPHTCGSEGFFWPIENLDWEKGEYSLSNKTHHSHIKLHAKQGRFLVVVPLRQGLIFRYSN